MCLYNLSSERADGASHNQDWERERETRERTRDHRSLEPRSFCYELFVNDERERLNGKTDSNMVRADLEKPQPVEVISGHHLFLLFFAGCLTQ